MNWRAICQSFQSLVMPSSTSEDCRACGALGRRQIGYPSPYQIRDFTRKFRDRYAAHANKIT